MAVRDLRQHYLVKIRALRKWVDWDRIESIKQAASRSFSVMSTFRSSLQALSLERELKHRVVLSIADMNGWSKDDVKKPHLKSIW